MHTTFENLSSYFMLFGAKARIGTVVIWFFYCLDLALFEVCHP